MGLLQDWQALWAEIERMVPGTLPHLAPPATPAQRGAVERAVGGSLPEAFWTLYSLYGGQAEREIFPAFFCCEFLSPARIAEEYGMVKQVVASGLFDDLEPAADPRIASAYMSPSFVPFLMDGGGNYLGVDLEPAPTGRVGQVVVFGSDLAESAVAFDSLEEMVGALLEQFRAGNVEADPAGPNYPEDPYEYPRLVLIDCGFSRAADVLACRKNYAPRRT